ncbi:hypothetical protein HG262_07395 [Achromobacter sp. Bel]|nr:hypothetical protein [Achromobacter sp. Bel]
MREPKVALASPENMPTSPPPIVTPSPMANIWIIENKLLPLAASRLLQPFRVTLFMAGNCMEIGMAME